MVISFESIPACDRQMDTQTNTPPIAMSRISIADAWQKVRQFIYPKPKPILAQTPSPNPNPKQLFS